MVIEYLIFVDIFAPYKNLAALAFILDGIFILECNKRRLIKIFIDCKCCGQYFNKVKSNQERICSIES